MQETLTAISGGECVGETLRTFGIVGQTQSTQVDITQNGISLTAQTTSPEGLSCSLTGTAGSAEFLLRGACNFQALAQCGNGELRVLRYESAESISMTGRLDGMTLVGTSSERVAVSTQSGATLEPLVVRSTFRGARR
jgi:hypothetical protein